MKLWDLATDKERATLQGHTKEDRETSEPAYGVESVAFSPDGKTLAAASHDMTVKVWDVATAKRATLQGHTQAVYSVAFSPDSKTLASASGDKTVRLWDVATGKERATLTGSYRVSNVRSVQPRRQDLGLSELRQDRQVLGRGHRQGASHPPGHRGGTGPWHSARLPRLWPRGDADKTIKLWDVDTGKLADN